MIDLKSTRFPLITYDSHLIKCVDLDGGSRQQIFVCLQNEILFHLKDLLESYGLFFDLDIARRCPLSMAFLHANYLDELLTVQLMHETNNMEHENRGLSRLFNMAVSPKLVNELEILRVNYLSLNLVLSRKQLAKLSGQIEADDIAKDDTDDDISIVGYNHFKYAIFDRKYIVVKKSYSNKSPLEFELTLYKWIMKHVLEIVYYPGWSEERIEKEANRVMASVVQFIREKYCWSVWPKASRKASEFRLSEIHFPDDDIGKDILTEFYSTESNPTEIGEQQQQPEFNINASDYIKKPASAMISSQFISDEDFYDSQMKRTSESNQLVKNYDFAVDLSGTSASYCKTCKLCPF
jgi:hypothetical protein